MSKLNWDKIQEEWETSKVTFKVLAEKHGVKIGTLKSRRSREKWSRDATNKKDATIEKDATQNNRGAQPKQRQDTQVNRSGNPNPSHKFPNHNSIQTKHGLFSKFLHEEQVEIIRVMDGLDFADQIWLQIELKFSAIIRMQKIMWVNDEHDDLKEVSGESNGMEGDSVSYKVIYAHERFESYIRAQSRAMAEYRNLVKQYIEITDEFDERRMKLESMQSSIDKTKVETEKIATDNEKVSPPTITIVDEWSDSNE